MATTPTRRELIDQIDAYQDITPTRSELIEQIDAYRTNAAIDKATIGELKNTAYINQQNSVDKLYSLDCMGRYWCAVANAEHARAEHAIQMSLEQGFALECALEHIRRLERAISTQ